MICIHMYMHIYVHDTVRLMTVTHFEHMTWTHDLDATFNPSKLISFK